MTDPAIPQASAPHVRLVPEGLAVGDELVPLHAGSVHYWRLDPRHWRACLQAVQSLGFRIVDTYVPWSVHEREPGVLELGERDPRLDVAAFLRLAHELGLYAIVRPGPHINAELTCFGVPERIVWDPACQARSPHQNPVVLPMLPQAFPVPSYASEAFLDEAARYFRQLGAALAPLVYPRGPIVMVQVDNEGAMYFRDGAYDQDYHPDAVAHYRSFLREKYKSLEELEQAYGRDPATDAPLRFADVAPPTRFDASAPRDLARHLDWAEFHEHLLARAMRRLSAAIEDAGFSGIPRSHNFPPGQEATPLNAARVQEAVELVGFDYYGRASESARASIARRTSELAVRSDALGVPPFACEIGAGFPPFFPPLDERDSVFTVLCALAYGLRGFNAYMAVERDRWIGAPIDPYGRERPFALFWRKLTVALERVRFGSLHRPCPVRIVTPRSERRLARVMHAFGPISGAFFSVSGGGARESALEDDLGLGASPVVEVDTFTRMIEAALDDRGVPYAHVGGEDRDVSLAGARWIVCVTSGGLSPALFDKLAESAESGALVTLGPRAPESSGTRRPLATPFDLERLRPRAPQPQDGEQAPRSFDRRGLPSAAVCPADPASVDALVAGAVARLGLPTWAVAPDGVRAVVHVDAESRPRVLFLINAGDDDCTARVTVGRDAREAVDLLKDQAFVVRDGTIELRMKPKTVRMLELVG